MSRLKNILDSRTKKELDRINVKLNKLSDFFSYDQNKKVLRESAEDIKEVMKSKMPVAPIQVKRYKSGTGLVVETYDPGHLRESIDIIEFKKSKNSVFIGPEFDNDSDPYYAHFVEFGTIYQEAQGPIRKTFEQVKNKTKADLLKKFKNQLTKYKQSVR